MLAKNGVLPAAADMWTTHIGRAQLDALELPDNYCRRLESLRDFIAAYDREIAGLERDIHLALRHDKGYNTIQALNGVGRTMAAIFVVEIGDVHRFRSAEALCSWAGLTPKHRESDVKVTRGSITKQGSKLRAGRPWRRWPDTTAAPGSSSASTRSPSDGARPKARVAVARKLLTLVYYGLRDGEIRALRAREGGMRLGHDRARARRNGMAPTPSQLEWRSRRSD